MLTMIKVAEACGVPGCTDCFKEQIIMDDHRIDRQRTVEFIKAERSLLRTISNVEDLTDDVKLLLPNRVHGFVLRNRKWHFLDIDKITPPQRHSEGFESLILPKGVARVVEGLVQTHRPHDMPPLPGMIAEPEHHIDLVRGKGKGLIILLYGAPGVGKTSTAECVAEYTNRPLFPITCGDIGETAKEVEQNLDQNFYLAHRWGCVLLLDEADVFLQARDKEDMRRNSVVSVFLRVLEYYSGILFLTTNKIGHFDEAFKSRIHVSLYYPPLDKKSTVQIWKMNLQRLVDSKRYFEVDRDAILDYAKEHYKRISRASGSTWNGRQIKNAFQTAIALAEFDAKKQKTKPNLTIDHFEVVAKASEGFDEYLSRIHGNDADRARLHGQRADDPPDDRFKRGQLPIPLKLAKKDEDTESSSSEESEPKEKRKRKKEKRPKKKSKAKVQDSESDDTSTD